VGVGVFVCVGVLVNVGVLLGVAEGSAVFVSVGVNVGPSWVWMINCGALAPAWRLARLMAVLLVVVRARLKLPLPVM
jgi:hypothetical protein